MSKARKNEQVITNGMLIDGIDCRKLPLWKDSNPYAAISARSYLGLRGINFPLNLFAKACAKVERKLNITVTEKRAHLVCVMEHVSYDIRSDRHPGINVLRPPLLPGGRAASVFRMASLEQGKIADVIIIDRKTGKEKRRDTPCRCNFRYNSNPSCENVKVNEFRVMI